jgi:hypothetical protein
MSSRENKSLADLANIKDKTKKKEKVKEELTPVEKIAKEELKTPDQIVPKRYASLKPASNILEEGIMNWNGFKVPYSGGKTAEFFDIIDSRRKQNKSCMIIITGDPGGGKTYAALRLGEIFDPRFNVEMTPYDEPGGSQVTFGRKQLMHLIGNDTPLQREQVIVIDEAQFAMGSRRWYEDVQKDLIEQVEAVRSRGFIIIIVALHLNLLDNIIRRYVLSFMIHMEDRGKGIVYRLYTPRFESEMRKKRLGSITLNLPNYELCKHPDCLRCPHLYPENPKIVECNYLRAVYERSKKAFIGNKNTEKEAQHEARERKRSANPPVVRQLEKAQAKVTQDIEKVAQRDTAETEIANKIIDHQDELRFDERNSVYEASSAQEILKKYYDLTIGRERTKRILKIIQKRLKTR